MESLNLTMWSQTPLSSSYSLHGNLVIQTNFPHRISVINLCLDKNSLLKSVDNGHGWPAVQGEVIKDSSKPKLIDDQGPHSSSLGTLEINVWHNSLNEPITVTQLVLGLQRYCVFCGLEEPLVLSRWTNHNIKKKPRQAPMEVLSVLWTGRRR